MGIRLSALVAAAVAAGCGGASTAGSTLQTTASHTASHPAAGPARAAAGQDWPMFGREPSRSSATGSFGLPQSAAGHLRRQRVSLPGVVDSSPIYAGGKFVVSNTYGRTIALYHGGRILL